MFYDKKTMILAFMVSVYPLLVIPGPLDYFRAPRYVILAIVALITLGLIVNIKDQLNFDKPLTYHLILFILVLTISTFFADDISMAWIGNNWRFTGLSTYLFCVILFIYSSCHPNPEMLLKPMIIGAVIAAMVGILQYFGVNYVPHEFYDVNVISSYSTMGNINWFGAYMVFVLPAAMLFYIKETKTVWLISTAIIYTGLLVSLTRGVWLVFFVIFIVVTAVLFKNKNFNKPFVIVVMTFIIITLAIMPVNDWMLLSRVFTVPGAVASSASIVDESVEATGSVFERIYIWKETVKIIKANPLTGIGLDHLKIEMPGGRIEDKAHNIYLEIAVASGLFALVAFLLFLSNFLRRQQIKTGFIFLVMILTYLLQGLFNNDIVQLMPLFWIVLGLSISNNSNSSSELNDPKSVETASDEQMKINENSSPKIKPWFTIVIITVVLMFLLTVLFWLYYPTEKTIIIPGEGTYNGQLRGSTFHGYGTWDSYSGVSYEGDFRRGLFDGYGILTFSNGSQYIGYFEEGYYHGEGELVFTDGTVQKGFWDMGRLIEN